jgi:uncharacterized phage protein (TIGR02218 family)
MSRDIPSVVQSWSQEVANRPLEIYQVFLDAETLRLAQSDVDVAFGGQTWTALGISRGEIRTSSELECDEVHVSLDNVNLAMADRIIATDFIGRRMVIYKVRRGDISSGQAMVLFDGRIDEPVLDQSKLVVALRSWLDGMHVAVPRRIFSSVCNYQLYDPWCTVSRQIDVNVGTGMAIGSSTNYTLVSEYLNDHADAYWGPIGTLWMQTGSNMGNAREVIAHSQSSMSVEVRIPFPFAINSGDLFMIERACMKTVANCCSKYGNYLNYGGFPTIPRAGLQIDMPTLGSAGGGGKK